MASNNNGGHWADGNTDSGDYGLQSRPMGLKVHYTFDKDSQVHCLARLPRILQVQTIPLDERNTIGIVSLPICLEAISQCSPELFGNDEQDYTVYAYDYSEPDTPLVGQGLLSRVSGQNIDPQPQLVTGRVTQNLLAIFGNGIRETLEVKLKLSAVAKPTARVAPMLTTSSNMDSFQSQMNSASTPTETAEWNSFIMSNPNLGHSANVSAIQSPVMAPARPFHPSNEPRSEFGVNQMPVMQASGSRAGSIDPSAKDNVPILPRPSSAANAGPASTQASGSADAQVENKPATTQSQSRPSSRASKNHGRTGRPRGRPRKNPIPLEGNTSGYEDGTDGDDGPPQKKRAKPTQVERSNSATFGSVPDSLRVAASTAGSLRNFRPIAAAGEGSSASHLQEVPRAPTPVPIPRLPTIQQSKPRAPSTLRRQSTSGVESNANLTTVSLGLQRSVSMSQGQDARSPADSVAAPSPSQSQAYSDEASPADIGSSPPVPRSAMYSVQSSPIPSSPILPPMPVQPLPDSGFMSGGLEDSRIEEDHTLKLPRPPMSAVSDTLAVSKPKPRRKPTKAQPVKKPGMPSQNSDVVFEMQTPGPPELLPTSSIYNPPRPIQQNQSSQAQPRSRKNSTQPKSPAASELPNVPQADMMVASAAIAEERPVKQETSATDVLRDLPQNICGLDPRLLGSFSNSQHFADQIEGLNVGEQSQMESPDLNSLSQGGQSMGEQLDSQMLPPAGRPTSEEADMELELPKIPASDPGMPQLSFPKPSRPAHPQTDAAESLDPRSNKNYVKKQAIKNKLEEAIASGQLPPFCGNCGAIQTPTWRKIWFQEHQGVPDYHEYSDKPGHVTAINIMKRDDDGKPLVYQMIKKNLGPHDDKSEWTEILLCNPCGIWFSKWKAHRPPEKWEKDHLRLDQVRKKRANGGAAPARGKKPRTKSDLQANLTSEAYLPTDAATPFDNNGFSPKDQAVSNEQDSQQADPKMAGNGRKSVANQKDPGSTHSSGSTHSRGSGTVGSPITLDDDLGGTRRLLFPSPRKDGEHKILGEVAINIVQTSPGYHASKNTEAEKENNMASATVLQDARPADDEFADIFGTPPRPSTPPPGLKAGANKEFKTPTRPTPSHRPLTRSVTKSMRSNRSVHSPSQLLLQRTPSKTPRSAFKSSSVRRRSPRHGSYLEPGFHPLVDETPFTRSLNQLLSEANDYLAPTSPGQHDFHLEMLSEPSHHFDLGTLLSTDGVMPSSPPVLRGGAAVRFGGSLEYTDTAHLWVGLGDVGNHDHARMGAGDEDGM